MACEGMMSRCEEQSQLTLSTYQSLERFERFELCINFELSCRG